MGSLLGLCPDAVPRDGDVEGQEAERVQLGRVQREVHVLRSGVGHGPLKRLRPMKLLGYPSRDVYFSCRMVEGSGSKCRVEGKGPKKVLNCALFARKR